MATVTPVQVIPVLSREHWVNVQRIVLFTILYRASQGIGLQVFSNPEVPVGQRDGTIHEMLFEFLAYTRPYTGEDWRLVCSDPVIAADVIYHIESEPYAGKDAIVAKWRELYSVP
jgi:hypothetical protein